jgi:hypothetical protein
MIRKWFSITVLFVLGIALFGLSSCARNTHLVSISVQPGNGTFAAVDPSLFFQYKAYGTYIHPPKTVDITDQVTWQTDNPQVAQVTSAGVVSPNTNCGVAQIFATMHDSPNDIVSNMVSITVQGPASEGCPQGGATNNLSVVISSGATDGVVASSPAGISCGSTCSAAFATGTSVALTATPNAGKSFNGWASGCTSITGNGATCNVTLNSDVTVTGSFN